VPWDESRVAGLCLISPSKKSFSRDQELRVRLDRKFFLARMFVFRICFQPIALSKTRKQRPFEKRTTDHLATPKIIPPFQNIQTNAGACVASLSEKTSFASVEATA